MYRSGRSVIALLLLLTASGSVAQPVSLDRSDARRVQMLPKSGPDAVRNLDETVLLKANVAALARTVEILQQELSAQGAAFAAQQSAFAADRAALDKLRLQFAAHRHRVAGSVGKGSISVNSNGQWYVVVLAGNGQEERDRLATTYPPLP